MSNLLERLETAGQVVTVQMDEVRFVAFNQLQAIGTRNLNSCSVVIVASSLGAVFAHIPPLPYVTNDPFAGDNHVQQMMDQVQTLVSSQRSHGYFPQSESLLICAVYQGDRALPSQMAIMQQALTVFGVAPIIRTYSVPTNLQNPAQGTVVVLAQNSQQPLVYIEDILQS